MVTFNGNVVNYKLALAKTTIATKAFAICLCGD